MQNALCTSSCCDRCLASELPAYSFAVRRLDPFVPLCHNVALVEPNGKTCLGSHIALALTGSAEESFDLAARSILMHGRIAL